MNLVVFDIDGTLIQYHRKRNDGAYVKALDEVFGVTVEDSWNGFISSTDSGILREIFQKRLGRNVTDSDISHFKQSMALWLEKEYSEEPFNAVPGALEAWDGLLNQPEWKMAVGTGNFEFAGRFKLASAGFGLFGIPLGTADDAETREKVLGASCHRALEVHGLERFEKIVYVGDWVWDVKAARALGWDFIGIATGEAAPMLRKAGAETILPDFKDFMLVLKALPAIP